MVLFTLALTVVAFKQHFLEEKLAEDTADSLATAKKSADAATASVEVARDNAERQLRAYVTVELGDLTEMEARKCPVATVLVTNAGLTPARDVSTSINVDLIRPGQAFQVPEHLEVTRVSLVIGSKYDKKSRQMAKFSLTDAALEGIRAAECSIVVSGCTVYEDVFGKTWWTQFCHIYDGPKLAGRYHSEINRGT